MSILKDLLLACAIIVGFLLSLVGIFLGFVWVKMRLEDSSYAERVFREMGYERVLASDAGNTLFWSPRPWDNCAYGVVSLPTKVGNAPPAPSRLPGFRERHIYVDEWQSTPTSDLRFNNETTLTHWCEPNFRKALFNHMLAAAETGGGWYLKDGRSLVVYSAPLEIAFVIEDRFD